MKGLLVMRGAEGQVTSAVKPKIAVYSCPLQPQDSETKTTVLIKTADELLNYTKSEEIITEKFIRAIADAGVTCVVVGGTVSELCLHYLEKYKIMVLKLTSKFELKRVCKCTGATPVTRTIGPKPDQLGYADEVVVQEIGSQNVTLFKRENEATKLCTLILRGNTQNLLDDLERAVNDGVHAYRSLLKDPRYVHGAGATEVYLVNALGKIGASITSLEQYAFQRFATAFEVVARILIENAGLNANETLTSLLASNHDQTSLKGIDVLAGGIKASEDLKIYDHQTTKTSAIKLATDAALTILRIDQVLF
jgi:T-complex protein 1 subunit theta